MSLFSVVPGPLRVLSCELSKSYSLEALCTNIRDFAFGSHSSLCFRCQKCLYKKCGLPPLTEYWPCELQGWRNGLPCPPWSSKSCSFGGSFPMPSTSKSLEPCVCTSVWLWAHPAPGKSLEGLLTTCPLKSPKASPSRTPTQHPLPKAWGSDGASLRLRLGPGEPSSSQWDLRGYNLQLENRLCSLPAGKMQKKRDTAKTASIRLWAEQKPVCSRNSVRAPGKRCSFEVPTGYHILPY